MIDEKKLIDELDRKLYAMQIVSRSMVLDIIKEQPKVGEWIPIRFRGTTNEDGFDIEEHPMMLDCVLPDDNEEVLVTTKLGYVLVDTFCNDGGAYFDCYDWDEITAWMPLPEPYKEGE